MLVAGGSNRFVAVRREERHDHRFEGRASDGIEQLAF